MTISATDVCPRSLQDEVTTVTCASEKIAHLDRFQRRSGAMSDWSHRVLGDDYCELTLDFEADQGALWCTFNHRERPCFTPRLLTEIDRLQQALQRQVGAAERHPVRTLVWSSALPSVWNLGGDLSLFIELIRVGADDALRRYAHRCVDTVYHNLTKFDLPLVTIALVQGDALGGGFEAVLTNDVIVAEQGSKFGLPEILFNMFPGMGAYSLLCRRLDGSRAQQLITSGRLYDAEEMEQMGLVDLVVEPGAGPAAVREYLARNARRHRVMRTLSQVRQRCQPVSRDELIEVTDLWVETALALDPADLRRMERLALAQQRRRARVNTDTQGRDAVIVAG